MAKLYDVRFAFPSQSLDGLWICQDTADQVGKMSDAELNHALKMGYVRERGAPVPDEESTTGIRNDLADPTADPAVTRRRGGSK